MALVLLCPAIGRAQAPSQEPVSDALMRAIENAALETLSFAETVHPAIDRSTFDRDSLLDRLDFDDAEVVRFVTEQIAYEPYAGLLRGAHGTLLARAGNALDQSLLLATLLNDAGFEAVIRGGTLSNDDAERLLRVLAERPEPPAALDEAVIEAARSQWRESLAALRELDVGTSAEPALTLERVLEDIERDRDDLLAALEEAGVTLGDPDTRAALTRETSEYFWVDYRTGPAASWIAAHPAFGGGAAPNVEAATTYAGDIPNELTHRLRLELVVEQRRGAELGTAVLMDPMEFPSANVAGRSLTLMLLPDVLMAADAAVDATPPAARTRFLLPLINGGLPAGAQALALDGTLVPPDLIQVSAAGLFQTVADDFAAAASALDALGGADATPRSLTAIESVRLTLTLIHPARGERTIERSLYRAPGAAPLGDAADPAARRAALVAELARGHTLGFAVGVLAPAYVLDETLAELEQLAPLIRVLTAPDAACETLDCLPRPELDPDRPASNVAIRLALFDRTMPTEPGSVVYRDAPHVVRLSKPFFPEASPVPGVFDILSNSRRAFRFRDGQSVPAPDAVLLAGVAETHLERIGAGFRGAATTIERRLASPRAERLRAWTDTPQGLGGAGAVEAEMIGNALASGSVVVTTTRADDAAEVPLGWWEIDAGSGRTLGMARHGGPSFVEWIVIGAAGTAVVDVLSSMAVCALARPQRISPTDGRLETAGFLACTVCTATDYAGAMLATGRDYQAAVDARDYCIDTRYDGFEPG